MAASPLQGPPGRRPSTGHGGRLDLDLDLDLDLLLNLPWREGVPGLPKISCLVYVFC